MPYFSSSARCGPHANGLLHHVRQEWKRDERPGSKGDARDQCRIVADGGDEGCDEVRDLADTSIEGERAWPEQA